MPILADSFETWPGVWITQVGGFNELEARVPGAEGPNIRASGAWDGRQALMVKYAGGGVGAEAVASISPALLTSGSLQLMLYVPSATFALMPQNGRFRIARLMSSASDLSSQIGLTLARGSGGTDRLFLSVEYTTPGGPSGLGSPTTTGFAPGTWHTVELVFDSSRSVVELYIDDLLTPRAQGPSFSLMGNPVGAVAVGLADQTPAPQAATLVWWIDDVKLGPGFLGYGQPRLHYHQDGFEAPNISVHLDPAGKSLVAASGSGSVSRIPPGHRDGGMLSEDISSGASPAAAGYGELADLGPGTGRLYHRVWWRQEALFNAGNRSLTAIGSSTLGTAGSLANPMAIIVLRADGSAALGGRSADGGTAEVTITPPLLPGWHLLELMVSGVGAVGSRAATVDGRPPVTVPANFAGVFPTQWIDGLLPDPAYASYSGQSVYDDSRTSPDPQPSRFDLTGGMARLGRCAQLYLVAMDSFGASAMVPEDAVVGLDAGTAGTFWGDPSCSGMGPLPSFLVPSGESLLRVYFTPSGNVSGNAPVHIGSPDYLPNTASIFIDATPLPDTTPPSVPGEAVPATYVTRFPLLDVSWIGSRDEVGGSGLWGYEVEANQNDGGWRWWVSVPAPASGMDGGFKFDGGESYWRLRVSARDDAGNVSAPGPESGQITVDTTAPGRPGTPVVALALGQAQVSWSPVGDPGIAPSGVWQYDLAYTDSTVVRILTVNGTSASVPVTMGATYTFSVAARDRAGNVSPYGPQTAVTVPGWLAGLRLLGLGSGTSTSTGDNIVVQGQNYPVRVEAIDSEQNVVTDYRGTVAFSASGAPGSVLLPPGGPYQFTAADQGRHRFDPGFTFQATGPATVSVTDMVSGIVATVYVTVIAPGEVKVVEDANMYGTAGIPYRYNSLGAVRAVSSDPVTFSACGGPAGFLVDPATGAVSWVPQASDGNIIDLCVMATTSNGASDDYPFSVYLVPQSPELPFAEFLALPDLVGVGAPVLFDPTGSTYDFWPPMFRWRFGDGSLPSAIDRPLHAYLLPGGYRPALTLWDGLGRSSQAARAVRVLDEWGNEPPSLAIQAMPHVGRDTLNVQLSSTVIPGTAAVSAPRWELGNGAHAVGATAAATYGPGRTWATAVVVDGKGLPATDKVEIAVFAGDREPPHCLAAADPPVAFLSPTGQAAVRFVGIRAPGSKEITSVSWTIDGEAASQGTVVRTYAAAGWHRGVLTVTDGHGLTCTDSVAVAVRPANASQSAVPPRILDPGAGGPALCGKDHNGGAALALGTPPLTWALAEGPQGMTVDSATGTVKWAVPISSATGTRYLLRVTGPAGSDTVPVDLAISCRDRVALDTFCGCGSGGAPAIAGLLLLGLWAAARRRLAPVRVRGRGRR